MRFSFRCCGNFSLAKKNKPYTWQAMKEQSILKHFVLKCQCSCNFKVLHIRNLKSSSNKSFKFLFKILCKACQLFGSAFSTVNIHQLCKRKDKKQCTPIVIEQKKRIKSQLLLMNCYYSNISSCVFCLFVFLLHSQHAYNSYSFILFVHSVFH